MSLRTVNQLNLRRWSVIAGIVVVLVLCVVFGRRTESHKPADRGPLYQGKDVAAWFDAIPGATDNDPATRTLIQIGRPAVPYLVAIASERPSLRHRVGLFLVREDLPGGLPSMLEKCGLHWSDTFQVEKATQEEHRQLDAIFVLDRMGPPAAEAPPALRRLARGGSPIVRFCALCAICSIGPTEQDKPLLVRALLRDKDWSCRCKGADGLAELGPKARSAVPALRKALADDHKEVRLSARRALTKVLPKEHGH